MRKGKLMILALSIVLSLAGCGNDNSFHRETAVVLTKEIVELEKDFSAVRYDGDYGFDKFLSNGGASSDKEVKKKR